MLKESSLFQRSSALVPALVAGLIGILLLGLGIPRLCAALQSLEAREVVWNVYAEANVPQTTLSHAAVELAAADAWVRDGEREGDRSLLLMHQAVLASTPTEQAKLWLAAEDAAVSALSVAPGQPSVWFRLAVMREQREDKAGAVGALRMSMLSGSYVPALMIPRIEQGLRLLPMMDHETLDLFKRQLRLTWAAKPEFIVTLSTRPGAGPLVREALDELNDSELAQFQRLHGTKP